MLFRRTILEQIQRLDPEKDDQRILYLSWYHDFPWDSRRALEFALFRTFAVPSIGQLLKSTGEFTRRVQKRYDDTDLLIAEFVEHGYDSERGRRAIKRMNQMHHRYPISNEDYLYVLSTFVLEPWRWVQRFGWRPYSDHERLAGFYFWKQVGRRMNIRDIPATFEELERFNVAYEKEHFRLDEGGQRVAEATRDLFLEMYLPRPLHPLGVQAIYALLDEPLREAFGFPAAPQWVTRTVEGALRARSRLLSYLPERRKPVLITQAPHATYPHGYEIEQLGSDRP